MMRDVSPNAVFVTDFVLVAVCFVFFALRLYVRVHILHKFEASDWLVGLAWCMMTTTCTFDYIGYKWNWWNPHIRFGPDGVLPDFEKYIQDPYRVKAGLQMMYLSQPITLLITYCVKVSFLLLYRQIFPPAMRKLRIALNVTWVVVMLLFWSAFFMDIFWCMPIYRNWTSNIPDRCLSAANPIRYVYVMGGNVLSDLLVYSLPFFLIPTLYRCTSHRELAGIIGMFSLGLLSIICTTGKILTTAAGTSLTTTSIWGTSEQASAIIVSCCPPLRYLVSRAIATRLSDNSKNSGRDGRRRERGATVTQTKTNWRFWRMHGAVGRDIESTVDSHALGLSTGAPMTTMASMDMTVMKSNHGSVCGGLAPAPRRQSSNATAVLRRQSSNATAVLKAVDSEAAVIKTTEETDFSPDEAPQTPTQVYNKQKGSFWARTKPKKQNRTESTDASNSSRNSRKGGDTFGGTQYTATQRGSNEEVASTPEEPLPYPQHALAGGASTIRHQALRHSWNTLGGGISAPESPIREIGPVGENPKN